MIPYSRPKLSDLYTYPRVNCLKTIPFTAAHTYIAHIWQYPPPPGRWLARVFQGQYSLNLSITYVAINKEAVLDKGALRELATFGGKTW